MMPVIEVVWRHLLEGARQGRRRWPSVSQLAADLDVPVSTAHRSLAHPVEIGAVSIGSLDGLQVLDPGRLLVLFAAHRRVQRDVIDRFRVRLPAVEVERRSTSPTVVLGGFGAVVAHSNGSNRIADYDTVLFYGDPHLPDLPEAGVDEGAEVLIASPIPACAAMAGSRPSPRRTPICSRCRDGRQLDSSKSSTGGECPIVTNPFYSSEETELSRAVLGEVLEAVPQAILIGGWGSWVRTGGPMSHDIGLIVTRGELAVLKDLVDDLSESHHLAGTKWRAAWRSIHLDLYAPYQSRLGANLQLRVERLTTYAERVNGYHLLTSPAHTATKIAALLDRPHSLPGRKDRQEILRLLGDPAAAATPSIVAAASTRTPAELRTLFHDAFAFLIGEPRLTKSKRARLRATEAEWQHALST